jgi:acetyltransferase
MAATRSRNTRTGKRLAPLFFPDSVAVIGASREPGKVGHTVIDNIINGGYQGKVLPVNPKADEIAGLKCYPSITSAGEAAGTVDLAVVVIPASLVPGVIEECGAAGVRAAIVISAGFRESGRKGLLLEQQMMEIARRYRMPLLGPNCLGLINGENRLNATFARMMPLPGKVALMSQSGALCTSILDWSVKELIGFSRFVSFGNKADVSESDLLRDWRADNRVGVVCAYLEQVSDGQRFLTEARLTSRKKPLIILKAGITDAGARAASSHTGSLAGSERAYAAAVEQTNSLPARSMEDFFDLISLTSLTALPGKGGVAILTNAGGPGILTTDACEKEGLRLGAFSRNTISRIARAVPGAGNLYNPVDILGDAESSRYRDALGILAADRDVASIIVILTPQAVTDIEGTARVIVEQAAATAKPIVGCFLGEKDIEAGVEALRQGGVPNFRFPERAVAALAKVHRYAERRRDEKVFEPVSFTVKKERVATALDFSRGGGYLHIGGFQALDVLKYYGLKTPKGRLAKSPDEASAIAAAIGFPVVMKVVSPNIMHKSDLGGIRVGVADTQGAREAFEDIQVAVRDNMPEALFLGVAVQEQVADAREVIIGVARDPQFGPLLMFGLGGIYVEVLKDVSFRIAPISRDDALHMMYEVKSYPLLSGARGEQPADTDAIVEALLRCSQLVTDFPGILELDLNPLLVKSRGQGAYVADARMVITP